MVEEAPKDTAWERARRKVYGNTSANPWSHHALHYQYANSMLGRPKTYNTDQVHALKEKLAAALSSASNIRALDAEDRVWIIVSGPGVVQQEIVQGGTTSFLNNQTNNRNAQNGWQKFANGFTRKHPSAQVNIWSAAKGTRLTISATKRAIDDLSDGTVTLKNFINRMQSFAQ